MNVWRVPQVCGVNSVYALLRFHDRPVDYDELRSEMLHDDQPASMLDLKRGLTSRGLPARVVRLTPEELAAARLPCIAHIEPFERQVVEEQGHFIVIIQVEPEGVRFLDGTTMGQSRLSHREFQKYWTGFALVIGADGGGQDEWRILALAILLGTGVGVALARWHRGVAGPVAAGAAPVHVVEAPVGSEKP